MNIYLFRNICVFIFQKPAVDSSILPRVADGLFSHHGDFRKEARNHEDFAASSAAVLVRDEIGSFRSPEANGVANHNDLNVQVIESNCCMDIAVEKPSEVILNPAGMRFVYQFSMILFKMLN